MCAKKRENRMPTEYQKYYGKSGKTPGFRESIPAGTHSALIGGATINTLKCKRTGIKNALPRSM